MDNKKLMQILLRDVSELEELVSGIKISGRYDPLDVELLHTRIGGVRHMLEVVTMSRNMQENIRETPNPLSRETIQVGKEPEIYPNEVMMPEYPKTTMPEIREVPEKLQPKLKEEPGKVSPEPVRHIITAVKEEIPKEIVPPVQAMHPVETVTTESPASEGRDDVDLEEEELVVGPVTLGEKFHHGRSVNDLLLEQGKSDTKFSHMPLASLHSAIGINDRFLFTRELFEGNATAFTEAVKKIDQMSGLQEAAAFLRDNFKWKKNDTSLKFIDLVKRRFT